MGAREMAPAPNYSVRDTSLRSFAVALTFSLGIVTVGLAGANSSTSTARASSAATLVAVNFGVAPAMLAPELDRPADRVAQRRSNTQRRSTTLNWALAMVVLVSFAVMRAGLTRWLTPPSEVAARSRILPRRAPQRAPPALSLALS